MSASFAHRSNRRFALVAGIGLLAMAVLAPLAHFGVLQPLIVPADAAATLGNVTGSQGPFRLAIAAFLVVAVLDVLVAWALYALLRPVHEALSLLVAWMRVVYAAVFAVAVANLLDSAELVGGTAGESLRPEQLEVGVMSSLTSFDSWWQIGLAIFGLHLVGLGALLWRSVDFPRFLGALVVLAGGGYFADSFIRILVPDITFTFSIFTFVGEALLIFWLFWRAARGSRSASEIPGGQPSASPAVANMAVSS